MSLYDKSAEIVKEIPEISDGITFLQKEMENTKKYNLIDEEIRFRIKMMNSCIDTPSNLEESRSLLNDFNDGRLINWLESKSNSAILTNEDKESTLYNLEIAKDNLLKLRQNLHNSEPIDLKSDIENLTKLTSDGSNVDKCIEGILKFNEKFTHIDFNEKLMEKKRDLEFEDKMKKLLRAVKRIIEEVDTRKALENSRRTNVIEDSRLSNIEQFSKRIEDFLNQTESLVSYDGGNDSIKNKNYTD